MLDDLWSKCLRRKTEDQHCLKRIIRCLYDSLKGLFRKSFVSTWVIEIILPYVTVPHKLKTDRGGL